MEQIRPISKAIYKKAKSLGIKTITLQFNGGVMRGRWKYGSSMGQVTCYETEDGDTLVDDDLQDLYHPFNMEQ